MFGKPRHLSRTSLIVISICLLVLLTFLSLSYLNLRTIDVLQRSTQYFSEGDRGVSLLRQGDAALDKAEDYYRIFINSGDSVYRLRFLDQMDTAIGALQALSDTGFARATLGNVERAGDLRKDIALLKRFSDSVVLSGMPSDTVPGSTRLVLRQVDKTLLDRYMAQATDTVRDRLVVRRHKNFFERLGALFFNKEDVRVQHEYLRGGHQGKGSKDSTQQVTETNRLSEQLMQLYSHSMGNQLAIQQALRDKERALAETNLAIVSGVESEIGEMLRQAEARGQTERAGMWAEYRSARASIVYIRWFSILTLLVLIGLLAYNTYRTNAYEKAILDAKVNAEKVVHLKSRFFSSVSHEIRSPLTGIMGFTEQALKEGRDSSYLRAIKTSSDHLLHVVNDILDFSSLEAGKLELVHAPFDVAEAVQEVMFVYNLQARKKGIAFESSSDATEPVMGDKHRFKQILYNLVGNAVKFTSQGRVTVRMAFRPYGKTRVWVTVTVKDTGPGIPKDEQARIFEEFAQVKGQGGEGTGLGLSVSRMLAELQGGTIRVDSAPGEGAVFTVRIPFEIATQDVAPGDQKAVAPVAPIKPVTGKILLVEDNELNVMLISHLLENLHCAFDVAADGEAAAQLFQDGEYGLVVTDINMPRLTGLELCALIRRDTDARKASTPVVALTAGMWGDDWETYRKAGINTVVPKPFKEESFRKIIEEYMAGA